jgi:hypothetical protein
MPTLRQLPGAVRYRAQKELKTRLVRSHRVPRYAYRHYFIETEGLRSRIHFQNFYSTMWPHLEEHVRVRVQVSSASGRVVGQVVREVAPFGGLFLDVADVLNELGADEPEGTVMLDTQPPESVLADLTSFQIPEQYDLLMGSPFWMAYFDVDENYMYVHSISPEMGRYFGVPSAVGRLLIQAAGKPAGRWRAGRLIDADGLSEMQIVLANHASGRRDTTLGIYDAADDACVWQETMSLGGHEVKRLRVSAAALDAFRAKSLGGQFRVGMDPLPTSNGKPYLLMRYGNGPLSLHHG